MCVYKTKCNIFRSELFKVRDQLINIALKIIQHIGYYIFELNKITMFAKV